MISVNLLGASRRMRRRQRPAARALFVTGMILFVLLMLEAGAARYQVHGKRAQRAGLLHVLGGDASDRRLASELAALETTKRTLVRRLETLTRVIDERLVAVELVALVSRAVPDDVWLVELREESANVLIEGRAASIAAIAEFAERLRVEGSRGHPVEIRAASAEVTDRVVEFRFQLSIRTRG